MATGLSLQVQGLPPSLDSSSSPPSVFDGTTRLYIAYVCPYAQRTWIARNYKGLQEKIQLVPIDLTNRPSWYKEKVYPENKVPSLEHNNQVKGESVDLVKYIDSHFEGPSLLPDDPAKKEFGEELVIFSDKFNGVLFASARKDSLDELDAAFDYLENALLKFNDGPFFLGEFSLVDIVFVPFIERFYPFYLDVKNYDITKSRPNLASWIQEIEKIEAYKQTKVDTKFLVDSLKKKFAVN